MNILMIEDDEFKARRVTQAIKNIDSTAKLRTERSINAGLSALTNEPPDILLLDMSLTTFSVSSSERGGRPQNFGGLDVLEQMDSLDLCIPVIVITQHGSFTRDGKNVSLNKLRKELQERYGDCFRDLVYYNSRESRWEHELAKNFANYKVGRNS